MYYSDYNRPQPEPAAPETAYPVLQASRRKKRTWPRVLALILVCALIGGGAGVGGAALYSHLNPPATNQPLTGGGTTTIYQGTGVPTVVQVDRIDGSKRLSLPDLYASNVGSVVGIVTQLTTNVYGQQVARAASGSGFVVTSDGYIVTNHHVIEGASSIKVSFQNGDEYDARLVGSEADNDLAVLKIDARGLTPVQLGNSGDLVVGEDVAAIGNPLGELTFTLTDGIVSAVDRLITMSDGTAINVLQTNCAINSGNSGGPLFNLYGQVIGITNAKYSNNGSTQASIEGICFAIPIDDVRDMIRDIIEHGYVTGKPYVGVTLATANAQNAARYGRSGGAYVQSLVPGAAAERAGLQVGDIITAVDGKAIESHAEFIAIKDTHRAGDTVRLTVDRAGAKLELDLTFDEKTPDDQVGAVTDPNYTEPFTDGWDSSGGRNNGGWSYGDIWDRFFNPFGR